MAASQKPWHADGVCQRRCGLLSSRCLLLSISPHHLPGMYRLAVHLPRVSFGVVGRCWDALFKAVSPVARSRLWEPPLGSGLAASISPLLCLCVGAEAAAVRQHLYPVTHISISGQGTHLCELYAFIGDELSPYPAVYRTVPGVWYCFKALKALT